jgi:hypothetical protein
MMGPQAGVQGVDLTREELDFQSEEVSVADIQAMAAVALADLGAGKKATSVKVGFGDENRRPRDCILFGLSEREVAMAVPTVVSLLVEHMDLHVPLNGDLLQGSSQYVQKQLELLDQSRTWSSATGLRTWGADEPDLFGRYFGDCPVCV